ncbi:MAG: oligosaccharide flippase family protein [Candidatus Zixiibacteriota bacterium]
MFHVVKNLAKHSAIYGVGDLLSKSIAFVMIPIYTHYLSTAQYGTLELLELTSYIVGTLLAMGISQSVVRYYYEYQEEEKRNQVVSVALITIWCVAGIAYIPLFFLSDGISSLVFKTPDNGRLFNLVFLTLLIGLANEIPMTLLRIKQKSVSYVAISLIRLILNLSLNVLFIVYLKMGVWGILVSSLISATAIGIYLLISTLRGIRLTYSREIARALLTYSVPLVGSWVGMYVLNFGDRFFLQRLASLSDVGIYSLAYKFGMMPNFLVLAPFLQIWGPKRFELVKEPDARSIYALVFTYFWFIQLFLSLGVSVMIKDVIAIVADVEFQSAFQYVPPILVSYMFYGAYSYAQFGILLQKRTKYLASFGLMAAAVNLAANFILIPWLGIWGAALATLLSFFFLFITVFVAGQRLYHIPYQTGRLVTMTLVAVALYAIAWFVRPPGVWLSLGIKFLIALTFPFFLYLCRFYSHEEIQKLKSLRNRVTEKVKGGIGVVWTSATRGDDGGLP